jgi:SOS-response transcriptional repressor LexA
MNEQPKTIRPTKKQKELLIYIESFIAENGYSPSYREIMRALNYNSVATVALHVSSLVERGHLVKRDKSARSLEVVNVPDEKSLKSNSIKPSEEKWLVEKVEYFFSRQESNSNVEQINLDELYVLIGALKIMGLEGAAQSFIPRLTELKRKVK